MICEVYQRLAPSYQGSVGIPPSYQGSKYFTSILTASPARDDKYLKLSYTPNYISFLNTSTVLLFPDLTKVRGKSKCKCLYKVVASESHARGLAMS